MTLPIAPQSHDVGFGEARPLVLLRAGSHLHGTATPASDLDAKAVILPSAHDILLQRVLATTVESRPRDPGERLAPGDPDVETHSLQRYLTLLASNQPLAIEMLFTPDALMLVPPDPLWREVQAIGPGLLTRRAGVFARYARRQADQYGVKGERAAAARSTLVVLTQAVAVYGTQARLDAIQADLLALTQSTPHTALIDIEVQENRTVRHLEVCGRKAPFSATIHAARTMAERLVASYGDRTAAAERQHGVDWKALSHAVRVGREAIELFTTGRLVFPLACAPHLLAIKLGQVAHAAVTAEIETMLAEVEQAAASSSLPDEPDLAAAEDLVLRAHRAQVLGAGA
jgi:predicted nucleotidyltransferase